MSNSKQVSIEDAYPITMLQEGMFFHSEYSKDLPVYHNIFTYRFHGPYDFKMLKEAAEHLVSRHQILRTSFHINEFSEPLQLVHDKVDLLFEEMDFQGFPSDRQKIMKQWLDNEKGRSFDWKKAPLFRLQSHRWSVEDFDISLSFHHSILDGWSVATMITEFIRLYMWKIGYPDNIPNEHNNVKFRDFVALEIKALQSEQCKDYWLKLLQDSSFKKIPRWPLKEPENVYKSLKISIPQEISEGLSRVSIMEGVPLKNVLLAAHVRVLSLVSGEKDIVTGVVSNGRPEKLGGEGVLGLFVNTLPLRIRLTHETWKELIQRLFEQEKDMWPYRRYPLAAIQRDTGNNLLFETAFNYINFHVYNQVESTSALQLVDFEGFEQTNFPFTCEFMVNPRNNAMYLILIYDANQFGADQVEAIGRYYQSSLKSIMLETDNPYLKLSVIPEQEYNKLAYVWSNSSSKVENVPNKYICELFTEQVSMHPGKPAVQYNGNTLSYHELNERSDQLAGYLIECGIKPNEIVGVYMERSLELVIGIMAIWKAGAAYVPLDPGYPGDRLKYITEDTKIEYVLSVTGMSQDLPFSKTIVNIDSLFECSDYNDYKNFIKPEPGSEDLAYVIYTSGSTGKPKGVLLTHKGLSNATQEYKRIFEICPDDRIIQLASLGFDASVAEFAMALGNGATICLPDGREQFIGYDLLRTLKEMRITIATVTPTALATLPFDNIPGLRILNAAGEACSTELARKWSQGRKFFNLYGPTEGTIWTTFYQWVNNNDGNAVPIGRPINNVEVYVLDMDQQVVPTGVPGELCIGGAGLARGYLNRPEMTGEKFIPHPLDASQKIYKTGDLVRYLPDGNIEFLGRIDNQVKIRGFRIELDEIANTLRKFNNINDAAVIVVGDQPLAKQLAAYIVVRDKESFKLNQLQSELREKLPNYMIPSVFVIVDSLSLTPHGKLNLKDLHRIALTRPESKPYVAPRTATERQLAEIWSLVLGIDVVGIHDDFFEMGGHSISALHVAGKIRTEFVIDFPLKYLFQYPQIEQLAILILNIKAENLEISELLAELDQMSDEDARKTLLMGSVFNNR